MSQVAAAAYCPFVAAAGPGLCGVAGFAGLEALPDLDRTWADPAYERWQAFRRAAGSRFVALTLPRVLARLPYGSGGRPVDAFTFEELEGADGPLPRDRLCWMGSPYILAVQAADSFAKYGWPVHMCGSNTGGRVEGLPALAWTDSTGNLRRMPTEWLVDPVEATVIGRHGLVPLAADGVADFAVFPSAQSVHATAGLAETGQDRDLRLAGTLPFLLATGRMMQYLLIMVRDRAGMFVRPGEAEQDLNRWIANFVARQLRRGRHVQVPLPPGGGSRRGVECPAGDAEPRRLAATMAARRAAHSSFLLSGGVPPCRAVKANHFGSSRTRLGFGTTRRSSACFHAED